MGIYAPFLFYSLNVTTVYQDIKENLNLVNHSMLCMTEARLNKLTLKEKKQTQRCKSHSQSATINRLDEIYGDQQEQSSTPKTFPDALDGIYYILMFFCDTVEKLKTAHDSLHVATVEAACKLRQTSIDYFFNVK